MGKTDSVDAQLIPQEGEKSFLPCRDNRHRITSTETGRQAGEAEWKTMTRSVLEEALSHLAMKLLEEHSNNKVRTHTGNYLFQKFLRQGNWRLLVLTQEAFMLNLPWKLEEQVQEEGRYLPGARRMRYNKFRRGFEVNSRDVTLQNILQNHAGHSTGPGQAQQGSETALRVLWSQQQKTIPQSETSACHSNTPQEQTWCQQPINKSDQNSKEAYREHSSVPTYQL